MNCSRMFTDREILYVVTTFTWLHAGAIISHVIKFDVATIQGKRLVEDGVYYTEAPSVQLLFNVF